MRKAKFKEEKKANQSVSIATTFWLSPSILRGGIDWVYDNLLKRLSAFDKDTHLSPVTSCISLIG